MVDPWGRAPQRTLCRAPTPLRSPLGYRRLGFVLFVVEVSVFVGYRVLGFTNPLAFSNAIGQKACERCTGFSPSTSVTAILELGPKLPDLQGAP